MDLRRDHLVSLPDDGWGELRLTHAELRSGSRWHGQRQAARQAASRDRAPGETRPVPIHP